ncbi:hypothetical protein [Terriglobus aquaticus]|uniref:Secreted protein n=1 Tax=Terriglobus aquaticus TaxID=940139 RepID=A0ABW9KS60_9BACT|nr:hypothetical protein [Terriglobus aquaticus]
MPALAYAHVGNKDVFQEVQAGPYRLFVTVRPPNVIPGVATVEVRSSGPEVKGISITPVPMVGEASKHPPTSDAMARSPQDPAFFSGSLWLMAPGSWKVQFAVTGAAGTASTSVPVPAFALTMLKMNRTLGLILGGLGTLLVIGVAGIVGAAIREARLRPGMQPDAARIRRSWAAAGAALLVVSAAVWAGGKWWNVEAADYADRVYQPLHLTPSLSGDTLHLSVSSYLTDNPRRDRLNSDFLPDHGHLMHLYAIREPGMDAVFHLHPAPTAPGQLAMTLPTMPAGTYRLFGDIVHRNGLPETLITELNVPEGFHGGMLSPEDASALTSPVSENELGPSFHLPDGYTMRWDRPARLRAGQPVRFRFTLLDPQGKPASDTLPYLGMAGHAAFVKADFSAFAHTHPEGSAPMQSLEVANEGGMGAMSGMDQMALGGNADASKPIAPTVEFPYGFPSAGRYRIFVQMKHGATVETGVFDAIAQAN